MFCVNLSKTVKQSRMHKNYMTHRWRWRKYLVDRHGQLCRVLAVGKMNSALIKFEDGYRVLSSRYAVRRVCVVDVVFGDLRKIKCNPN